MSHGGRPGPRVRVYRAEPKKKYSSLSSRAKEGGDGTTRFGQICSDPRSHNYEFRAPTKMTSPGNPMRIRVNSGKDSSSRHPGPLRSSGKEVEVGVSWVTVL